MGPCQPGRAGQRRDELLLAASAVPGAEKWAGLRTRGCCSARPGRGAAPGWVVPAVHRRRPFPVSAGSRERCCAAPDRRVRAGGEEASSALELPGAPHTAGVWAPADPQGRTGPGTLCPGGPGASLLPGIPAVETAAGSPASTRPAGESCTGLTPPDSRESRAVPPFEASFSWPVSCAYLQDFSIPKENI